jgi:hypothetical protein
MDSWESDGIRLAKSRTYSSAIDTTDFKKMLVRCSPRELSDKTTLTTWMMLGAQGKGGGLLRVSTGAGRRFVTTAAGIPVAVSGERPIVSLETPDRRPARADLSSSIA